mgnify:CR=1 FL=1
MNFEVMVTALNEAGTYRGTVKDWDRSAVKRKA